MRFQERWRRGEPVVVEKLQEKLTQKWGPVCLSFLIPTPTPFPPYAAHPIFPMCQKIIPLFLKVGFLERFGAEQVQMIDCRDGKSVHWLTLAHFFSGYLTPWTRALCPDTFRRMMLKLKDWPPDQDFRSKMPEYFEDLMQAAP